MKADDVVNSDDPGGATSDGIAPGQGSDRGDPRVEKGRWSRLLAVGLGLAALTALGVRLVGPTTAGLAEGAYQSQELACEGATAANGNTVHTSSSHGVPAGVAPRDVSEATNTARDAVADWAAEAVVRVPFTAQLVSDHPTGKAFDVLDEADGRLIATVRVAFIGASWVYSGDVQCASDPRIDRPDR